MDLTQAQMQVLVRMLPGVKYKRVQLSTRPVVVDELVRKGFVRRYPFWLFVLTGQGEQWVRRMTGACRYCVQCSPEEDVLGDVELPAMLVRQAD